MGELSSRGDGQLSVLSIATRNLSSCESAGRLLSRRRCYLRPKAVSDIVGRTLDEDRGCTTPYSSQYDASPPIHSVRSLEAITLHQLQLIE